MACIKPQTTNVISKRTAEFHRLFDALPSHVQKTGRDKFENLFCADHHHPLLEGHWVPDRRIGEKNVWAVSLNYSYRAMALVLQESGNAVYVWYWCGSHEEYNGRLG